MDGLVRESENKSFVPPTSSPQDPFLHPVDSIKPWTFQLLAALMFLVTALSLTENFTIILVTVKFKQLRQPVNYVIVNLSVADFLVSLIGGTISFLTNLKGYFYMGHWACVLEGFAVTFFGIVALWSLALLAFERYFVICRPLGNMRLRGKHAALGIAFVWVFSFIWTIPPTMGWSSYTTSKIGTTCEPNWYSGDYNDHTYIITFFTTCFILPLLVILISYGKLMRKLKKARSNTKTGVGIRVVEGDSLNINLKIAGDKDIYEVDRVFRRCLIQLFRCSDRDVTVSNMNQVSDRATLTHNKNCEEMPTLAAQLTVFDQRIEDDHTSCRSFAQLAISENKVCPV
uniref:Uncharacterized protein n=1 Tax=Sphaerodactylus townsendi TaxID=933632 RepID=A0ACB8F9B5_9SAUR